MHSKTIKRVLGSFAVVGVTAAMAGLGTFATFTSSTSASHTISSGTVSIALGTTGAANRPVLLALLVLWEIWGLGTSRSRSAAAPAREAA